MKPTLKTFFCALLLLILQANSRGAGPVDGIVLLVADGTSQELLTASRLYLKGADGRLALESLPHTAVVRTVSRSSLVTDSAAAATAMARGIKADNRVLGMETAKSQSGPASVFDVARKAGWSTAVITDDSVTGATPSAFLVEHGRREDDAKIAAKEVEQLGKRVDLLLGGGSAFFRQKDADPAHAGFKKIPQTEEALKSPNIAAFFDWEAFSNYVEKGGDEKPVLGVFSPREFSFYADGERELRLRDLVEAALTLLKKRGKPFLMVVEAGLPDKACHLNNAKRAIIEVGELDATIAWLQKNLPPRTLILATTDHNNGGLTISDQLKPRSATGDALLLPNLINGQFMFTWATGPGAGNKNEGLGPGDPHFAQPAVYPRGSASHSGGDVWLLAGGPGSERVHGFLDNTDIARIIRGAIEESAQ